MRRATLALAAAAGSAAAATLWRRAGRGSREHVDLYYDDGSMISFPADSPQAARLVPLARDVLAAARG